MIKYCFHQAWLCPLTACPENISVFGMRFLLRRLVILLVALAFIAGGAGGFAVPIAAAADPCMDEPASGQTHHSQKLPTKPGKQDSTRTCQQCCFGICVSVPNFQTTMIIEPVAVTSIAYWDTARFGIGRSIKPEHGPPRLFA